MTSEKAHKAFLETDEVIVIGYFEKDDSPLSAAYHTVSKKLREKVKFAHTSAKEVLDKVSHKYVSLKNYRDNFFLYSVVKKITVREMKYIN